MITDEQFKKTENMLYRYYRQQREIERLQARIRRNEQRRDEIYKDIKETNVNLDTEVNMAVSFDEKVQTSNLGTSFAEKETVRQIEKLEKERAKVGMQIQKTKEKVIPMVVKMKADGTIKLGEYDDLESISLEKGEIVVKTFNHLEEFKKQYAERFTKKEEVK